MRENRPSASEGGAGANPLFLPLSNSRSGRLMQNHVQLFVEYFFCACMRSRSRRGAERSCLVRGGSGPIPPNSPDPCYKSPRASESFGLGPGVLSSGRRLVRASGNRRRNHTRDKMIFGVETDWKRTGFPKRRWRRWIEAMNPSSQLEIPFPDFVALFLCCSILRLLPSTRFFHVAA